MPLTAQFVLSSLQTRQLSHLFASTSHHFSVVPSLQTFSPQQRLKNTPNLVQCSATREYRVPKRTTQQFFDDDDDWNKPAEPEEPFPVTVSTKKPKTPPKNTATAASTPQEPSIVDQYEQLAVPEIPSQELLNIHVKSAEFVKSSKTLEQCPPPSLPEFAVIGRSNVGKSSIINMLTGRKSLALVSKTPGKTVCINHFIINKAWYLVDLPGYGYAKRSKTDRTEWSQFTREYFVNRESLANVLLLVDASIPPQEIDINSADWLGDSHVPYTLVFTKYDKRKKRTPTPDENIQAFMDALSNKWETVPPTLVTSSNTGMGKVELLQHIAQLREFFKFTGAAGR